MDVILKKHNIHISDKSFKALLSALDVFQKRPEHLDKITLEGIDSVQGVSVQTQEFLQTLSSNISQNIKQSAEIILDFVKKCIDDSPNTIYITGKNQLYPNLQDELQMELKRHFRVIVPDRPEDAVLMGMTDMLYQKMRRQTCRAGIK